MKKFNKSKIMQLAHHLRKQYECTLSDALKLAWDTARRSEFYWIIEERKPTNKYVRDINNPQYQASMLAYYNRGTSAYYGD